MLGALVAITLVQTFSAPPVSPQARALVAAVAESVGRTRAAQAALPPPKDDAERLLRIGELDQAPRRVIVAFDFATIPEAEREAAIAAASEAMEAVDRENLKALLELLPPDGWFLRSRYGDRASHAAFLVLQHGDTAMQKRFLPILEKLVPAGEAQGSDYALMFDRVAVAEGRPQRFGSQFRCDGGKYRPYPLEDPGRIDELRRAMGFRMSFADYRARFEAAPTCPQTRSPPPHGMKLD